MGTLNFKPYVQAYLNEQTSTVTLSRPFRDNGDGLVFELSPIGLRIFNLLELELEKQEFQEEILREYPDGRAEMEEILAFLLVENYIEEHNEVEVPPHHRVLEERYNRLLPVWSEFETDGMNRYEIQQNIMSKTIGVIGCGTIGLGVIGKLAASGISKFVLFDSDVVEETNLPRQILFTLEHIGASKLEIAKRMIEQRQQGAVVETHNQTIRSVVDMLPLEHVDLIVVAGDYPSYRELGYIVQEFCFKHQIPISYAGGYSAHVGKIYPLVIPGKTVCFDCISRQVEVESSHLGRTLKDKKTSVSTTVQMGDFITSIVSFEILKHLSGTVDPYLIDKSLIVSFRSYQVDKREFHKQPDCSYCRSKEGGSS